MSLIAPLATMTINIEIRIPWILTKSRGLLRIMRAPVPGDIQIGSPRIVIEPVWIETSVLLWRQIRVERLLVHLVEVHVRWILIWGLHAVGVLRISGGVGIVGEGSVSATLACRGVVRLVHRVCDFHRDAGQRPEGAQPRLGGLGPRFIIRGRRELPVRLFAEFPEQRVQVLLFPRLGHHDDQREGKDHQQSDDYADEHGRAGEEKPA